MKEKFSPKHKVQLRGGFSDRNGIDKIPTEMQLHDFDARTRTCIINKLHEIFDQISECAMANNSLQDVWKDFFFDVIENVYVLEKNEIVYFNYYDLKRNFDEIWEDTVRNGEYHEILTIIEYFLNFTKILFRTRRPYDYDAHNKKAVYYDEKKEINKLFEKEYVGYRFIEKKIAPITDEIEVKEIEDAFTIKYQGAKAHIAKALEFLSDREKPDYKNSIKESISAVESICKIIVGNDHATLGDALKILEKKNGLKGQLKSGFEKLYNYTNDKGGIRHAEGLFESNVTFEEAKFMLVSCCAFVNYLLAEYGK